MGRVRPWTLSPTPCDKGKHGMALHGAAQHGPSGMRTPAIAWRVSRHCVLLVSPRDLTRLDRIAIAIAIFIAFGPCDGQKRNGPFLCVFMVVVHENGTLKTFLIDTAQFSADCFVPRPSSHVITWIQRSL